MRGLSALRRACNSDIVSDRLLASRPARRCKETTLRTLRQPYPRRRRAHRPSRANPASAIYSQARRRFRRVSIRVRFGCRCLSSSIALLGLMDRLMTCFLNPLDLVSVPCASKTAIADSGRRTVRRAFFPFRSNWATRMASGSIVAVSITSRVRPACPWSRWSTNSKPVSWGRECSAPLGVPVFVAVIVIRSECECHPDRCQHRWRGFGSQTGPPLEPGVSPRKCMVLPAAALAKQTQRTPTRYNQLVRPWFVFHTTPSRPADAWLPHFEED